MRLSPTSKAFAAGVAVGAAAVLAAGFVDLRIHSSLGSSCVESVPALR
jgi:hypothetical protein